MQKKRIQSKRIQIKPTLNVQITLTADVSKFKENVLPSIAFILNVLSGNEIIFGISLLFFKIKQNNVCFTKAYSFVRLRRYV